jgi:O-antigen/teichoic acid export membrane protein
MASYNRIDSIILVPLAGEGAAGIYAGAFRLLDALTMVAYLVSVPLLPVFSRLCRDVDKLNVSTISDILRLIFPPMMVFAIGAAVTFSFMGEELMQLLYGDAWQPYVPVFRILIFGIVPIGITYVFGTLLTAGGRLKQLNILAATSLVLNVAVNLVLIPRIGATGSAVASLAAQTFMALTQMGVACRLFGFGTAPLALGRIAGFALVMVGVNYACMLWSPEWWLWLAVAAGAALLSALTLKLVDVKHILEAL